MGRLSLIIEVLTLIVDIGILWVLLIEFNYDKIQDEKREYKEVQKKRKKALVPPSLPSRGDKKDVAVEPGAPSGPQSGPTST